MSSENVRRAYAQRRSTTGCSFCKSRRKKCDETKPQCLRCSASGRQCSYEYVEYTEDERHRIKRTKPGPRTTSRLSAKVQSVSSGSSPASPSKASVSQSPPAPFETWNTETWNTEAWNTETWNTETYQDPTALPCDAADSPLCPTLDFLAHPHQFDNLGQSTSPFTPLNPIWAPHVHNMVPIPSGSISRAIECIDVEDDENDPEGVGALICISPIMDRNVQHNALPFTLHCYFQWILASVFEPLKIAHTIRDHVISRFSSEKTRIKTILIANVMDMFAKNLTIDGARKEILSRLALEAQESSLALMSTRPSNTALDRQEAMRLLDSMLEVFALQTTTQPIAACIQSIDFTAPIFRRACTEPPGQPINLLNILRSENLNLRHFATVDIIKSITTNLPTCFPYYVPFSLELCEEMGDGLKWLYGFPDQFILLLAWINSLCYRPGRDTSQVVTWIETNLPHIKISTDQYGDPALRIARIVVQECWRFVVLIYMYMALCKVDAHDPRVIRAQKGFMKLVRSVKPSRNPDLFLFRAMIIAGVATTSIKDQSTLRDRILNVRECAERGTVGNDIMLELEDIWTRTRNEGRVAVWEDLMIANSRVMGL